MVFPFFYRSNSQGRIDVAGSNNKISMQCLAIDTIFFAHKAWGIVSRMACVNSLTWEDTFMISYGPRVWFMVIASNQTKSLL